MKVCQHNLHVQIFHTFSDVQGDITMDMLMQSMQLYALALMLVNTMPLHSSHLLIILDISPIFNLNDLNFDLRLTQVVVTSSCPLIHITTVSTSVSPIFSTRASHLPVSINLSAITTLATDDMIIKAEIHPSIFFHYCHVIPAYPHMHSIEQIWVH